MPRKETRADRVIKFVELFCLVPEGAQVGQPMKLAPFQKKFIRDIYDNKAGTRRAYLSIARKNGKTGLIAALVLAHLVGPEAKQNSQIVSGARSRDQAALVFNLAAKMVSLSSKLSGIVRIVPSGKRLIGLRANVEYRALAADGTTAHGLSPVLAILDEVGQVRGSQDDFIDAITTSQGAHDAPLLIAISTQAANDADLFSIWIDDAKKSNDPRIVSHVYAADPDLDLDDVKAWKAANPALGLFRSKEDVREQALQAKRMPSAENTFRNLVLNQRVVTIAPFISAEVWKANAGPVDEDLFYRVPVYAGLDLSARIDLTAFVLIAHDGERWHVRPYFWTPEQGLHDRAKRDRAPYDVWVREGRLYTTPGASVDYEFVVADIAEIVQRMDVRAVSFDPHRFADLEREANRAGLDLPFVKFAQTTVAFEPAVGNCEAELLNSRVAHGGHPVLTMCAANAVLFRDSSGNRKLDKRKTTGRIDGMVALLMAFGAATSSASATNIEQGFVLL